MVASHHSKHTLPAPFCQALVPAQQQGRPLVAVVVAQVAFHHFLLSPNLFGIPLVELANIPLPG